MLAAPWFAGMGLVRPSGAPLGCNTRMHAPTSCKLRAAEARPPRLDGDPLDGLYAAVRLAQELGDDGRADLPGRVNRHGQLVLGRDGGAQLSLREQARGRARDVEVDLCGEGCRFVHTCVNLSTPA